MDSPFIYTKSLQNDAFLGRQNEINWLSSNLIQGAHTIIIEPPFSGKQSLINQGFLRIQKQKTPIKTCSIHLYNIRSWDGFLLSLAEQTIKSFVNTLGEWKTICSDLLPLSNPTVRVNEKKMNDVHLTFAPPFTDEQKDELLALPERLCSRFQERLIVCIHDFQNISFFEDSYKSLINALKVWKQQTLATYLATASKPNIMHVMDGSREILMRVFERIPFVPIEEKVFVDYIIRGFAKAGRVISKEMAELLYRKMEGHPYYTQHLAHLCFINTKGFMNNAMFNQAYEELLDIHHRRFTSVTDDLTPPQINYLRAVTHNIERFCTIDVLKKYGLNSSANVTRVRMALEKKEILEFVRNKPQFQDPLFKIWFTERFNSFV
ncbi:MAG: hypothetical protein FWD56_05785 [Bacteroidales bacterium]|nr:hypothetical protein [Bacteroidales bacterium]